MPIYEYQCRLCNHQLEALQKTSDEPLTLCPACKNEGLIKLISAASFQLKGTGWYATDFRDKQKTATSTTETKADSNDSTHSSGDTSTKESKKSGNGEAA